MIYPQITRYTEEKIPCWNSLSEVIKAKDRSYFLIETSSSLYYFEISYSLFRYFVYMDHMAISMKDKLSPIFSDKNLLFKNNNITTKRQLLSVLWEQLISIWFKSKDKNSCDNIQDIEYLNNRDDYLDKNSCKEYNLNDCIDNYLFKEEEEEEEDEEYEDKERLKSWKTKSVILLDIIEKLSNKSYKELQLIKDKRLKEALITYFENKDNSSSINDENLFVYNFLLDLEDSKSKYIISKPKDIEDFVNQWIYSYNKKVIYLFLEYGYKTLSELNNINWIKISNSKDYLSCQYNQKFIVYSLDGEILQIMPVSIYEYEQDKWIFDIRLTKKQSIWKIKESLLFSSKNIDWHIKKLYSFVENKQDFETYIFNIYHSSNLEIQQKIIENIFLLKDILYSESLIFSLFEDWKNHYHELNWIFDKISFEKWKIIIDSLKTEQCKLEAFDYIFKTYITNNSFDSKWLNYLNLNNFFTKDKIILFIKRIDSWDFKYKINLELKSFIFSKIISLSFDEDEIKKIIWQLYSFDFKFFLFQYLKSIDKLNIKDCLNIINRYLTRDWLIEGIDIKEIQNLIVSVGTKNWFIFLKRFQDMSEIDSYIFLLFLDNLLEWFLLPENKMDFYFNYLNILKNWNYKNKEMTINHCFRQIFIQKDKDSILTESLIKFEELNKYSKTFIENWQTLLQQFANKSKLLNKKSLFSTIWSLFFESTEEDKEKSLEDIRKDFDKQIASFIYVYNEKQFVINERISAINMIFEKIELFSTYLDWTSVTNIKELNNWLLQFKANIELMKNQLNLIKNSTNQIGESLINFKTNLNLLDTITLENTTINLLKDFNNLTKSVR